MKLNTWLGKKYAHIPISGVLFWVFIILNSPFNVPYMAIIVFGNSELRELVQFVLMNYALGKCTIGLWSTWLGGNTMDGCYSGTYATIHQLYDVYLQSVVLIRYIFRSLGSWVSLIFRPSLQMFLVPQQLPLRKTETLLISALEMSLFPDDEMFSILACISRWGSHKYRYRIKVVYINSGTCSWIW